MNMNRFSPTLSMVKFPAILNQTGILFILIGLIILSSEYVWAHHLLAKLRERFPKVGKIVDQASEKAKAWMQRLSSQREAN